MFAGEYPLHLPQGEVRGPGQLQSSLARKITECINDENKKKVKDIQHDRWLEKHKKEAVLIYIEPQTHTALASQPVAHACL